MKDETGFFVGFMKKKKKHEKGASERGGKKTYGKD